MKKQLLLAAGVFIIFVIAVPIYCQNGNNQFSEDASNSNRFETDKGFLPLVRRKAMSKDVRFNWLEKYGSVPDDADRTDWQLAKNTTWWGKPLDTKAFWNGKVVWLSREARKDSLKYGRKYPPIPYPYAQLPQYQNKPDLTSKSGGIDSGDGIAAHYTDGEKAFWDHYTKTHPMPPENIHLQQILVTAKSVPRLPPGPMSPTASGAYLQLQLGFPPEAFSEDALFWTYVFDKRQEYELLQNQKDFNAEGRIKDFLSLIKVDPEYVIRPLSNEEIQAASSWKVAYLQRLKRQNTDPSYINAYLQAWKLRVTALNQGTK